MLDDKARYTGERDLEIARGRADGLIYVNPEGPAATRTGCVRRDVRETFARMP